MQETGQQRILLVDDAPENIEILTGALEGYKKIIALNGEKALKLATGPAPPDLILLDILMPGMDGFEVIKHLKADERTREIPVIFLTGETDSESVVMGFELGAVDYVTKPFNIGELLARVNTQMALKHSRDAVERYSREIEEKNKLITDSISYASLIQNAILPKEHFLAEVLHDFFVLFRPKDIVSGDFYWAKKANNRTIIVAADCTGHGVPGAFMSMFGVAFLNEVVMKENITSPSLIMDRLRDLIIQSLAQDIQNKLKDGMDMAIVSIDHENMQMEFAGAQNPIYLVRNKELSEIPCDRMPVAIHTRMDPFTNHEIPLKKGDQIYMFSDGFADQFGGPNYKKFKYKAFREMILDYSDNTMKEQLSKIENTLDAWKGSGEQIDDILLIGIKI